SDNVWYYYPAIIRDPAGNMAMVFNRSGANEYIGAHYTTWAAGEANWEPSVALKPGEASYGSGANLWGSYSGAALDPTEPGRAWVYGEYAASASQWGTWIGELSFSSLTNDGCNGAIALSNGVPFSMNTSSASSTNDPILVCGTAVGKGVWFSFTPTATGTVLLSTCGSDFPTVLQVYSGNCASPTVVACNA